MDPLDCDLSSFYGLCLPLAAKKSPIVNQVERKSYYLSPLSIKYSNPCTSSYSHLRSDAYIKSSQ